MPQIQLEGYQILCLTTPTRLLEIEVTQLRSLLIRNLDTTNSIFVGSVGVQLTSGIELAPGEALGFDHMDFKPGDSGLFQIYGIAQTASCIAAITKVYVL